MARYFETSSPEYLDDAMFELPVDLMTKALEVKDGIVNKNIDSVLANQEYLTVDPLEEDKERALSRVRNYNNEIDELVNTIANNPDDNYRPKIQGLTRRVYEDSTVGHLAKINQNKKDYIEWYKKEQARYEKDPENFNPQKFQAINSKLRADYASKGGYYSDSEGLRNFGTEDMIGTAPLTEHVKEAFDGKVGKITEIKTDTETGQMRYITDIKKEGWTEEEILTHLGAYTEARPDLVGALSQDEKLGLIDEAPHPAYHLLNYATAMYKQKVTLDSEQNLIGDVAKATAIKKLDEPDAIIENVESSSYKDMTKFNTYEEAIPTMIATEMAPNNYVGTLRKELQLLDPNLNTADMALEDIVAELYPSSLKSQEDALRKHSELKKEAFFAHGVRKSLEKNREQGKKFTEARGELSMVDNSKASWAFTGTGEKTVKAIQDKVATQGHSLPIENITSANYQIRNNDGVSVVFSTPNSSPFTSGGRGHKTGTWVANYAKDGKNYTVVIDPKDFGYAGQKLTEGIVGKIQADFAKRVGISTGQAKIATLVNFGSDVVTPAQIASNNIYVGSTSVEEGRMWSLNTTTGLFENSTDSPYKNQNVKMDRGFIINAKTFAPSDSYEGYNVNFQAGKTGANFNARVPRKMAGAFNTDSTNSYFDANADNMSHKSRMTRNGVSVNSEGKVKGWVGATRLNYVDPKDKDNKKGGNVVGKLEVTPDGTVYYNDKPVKNSEQIKILIRIAEESF